MKVTLSDYNVKLGTMINGASSICYDSDPDKNRITKLQESGHLSCFRFAWFVFEIEGISRTCSHQLVRHKHLDYLQLSQRYVNMENQKYVIPESILSDPALYEVFDKTICHAEKVYKKFIKLGIKKEDARFVLPQAIETSMYISGNLQAWLNFCNLRNTKHAQWEIRQVAKEIQRLILEKIPEVKFNKP